MKNNLSEEDLLLMEDNANRICRKSFWAYRQIINNGMKRGWFQRETARVLQKFYDDYESGKRPILIIESPPQHGKTTQVIDFVSWLSGKNPDTKTIYASFSERLGIRANLKMQRILDGSTYKKIFPDTRLNDKNTVAVSSQNLRNREIVEFVDREGYFRSTTALGSITGESADIVLLDDILKGAFEASSFSIRDKKWEWVTMDVMTRLSEKGSMIVIGTRWHIDDPIGRLRETYKDRITVLSFPAIAEQDETFRMTGEALFPEHKSLDFLLERKRSMNSMSWNSLYQQNPVPEAGNIFKAENFKYFRQEKNVYWMDNKPYYDFDFEVYQTVDPAGTDNKGSDYFVCLTFAVHKKTANILVLDVFREHCETTRHMAVLDQQYEKWNPIAQYVENRTFGINIIQAYKETGRPVRELKADSSKVSRSEIIQTFYENGKVFHRQGADYMHVLESELLDFPNGKHDDTVDCIAYAGIIASQKNRLTVFDIYEVA